MPLVRPLTIFFFAMTKTAYLYLRLIKKNNLDCTVSRGWCRGYPVPVLTMKTADFPLLVELAALLTKRRAGALAKTRPVLAESPSTTLAGPSRGILSLALVGDGRLEAAVSLHRVGDDLDTPVGQVDPVLARRDHTVRLLLVVKVVAVIGLSNGPVEVVRHPLTVKRARRAYIGGHEASTAVCSEASGAALTEAHSAVLAEAASAAEALAGCGALQRSSIAMLLSAGGDGRSAVLRGAGRHRRRRHHHPHTTTQGHLYSDVGTAGDAQI